MTEWIEEILSDEGYAVSVANDGIRGDELLAANKYDLLLLDIKMPGIDGLGILRRLRERGSAVKVIILSARPLGKGLSDHVEALGTDDIKRLQNTEGIMTKPCQIAELLTLIRKAIGQKAKKVG